MSIPLKVYKPGQPEEVKKPRPLIAIEDGSGKTVAVAEDGGYITYLWGPSDTQRTVVCLRRAQHKLQSEGYDTSWAEWDSEGRFVRWAE